MDEKLKRLQKALAKHNSASFPKGNIGASGRVTNSNRVKDHKDDSANTKLSSPSLFSEERKIAERSRRSTVSDKDMKDAGKLPPLKPLKTIKPAKPVLPAKPKLPKP